MLFPNAFSWFGIILSLPFGALLAIVCLIALFKEKRRQWPALAIVLIAFVVYLAFAHLLNWGALANFYLHRRYYETTARALIMAHTDVERKQICGDRCWLMSTDPPRPSFHYVDGFLNWYDIVYDPSGAVMTIKTYDEKRKISFYFRSARHLTGDWYLCHFSD